MHANWPLNVEFESNLNFEFSLSCFCAVNPERRLILHRYYSPAYSALRVIYALRVMITTEPAVVQNPDISKRSPAHVCASGFPVHRSELCARALPLQACWNKLCRDPLESSRGKCPLLLLSGRGCLEFELPADLLGSPLGKSSNKAPQDGGGQTPNGRRSSVRARLGRAF